MYVATTFDPTANSSDSFNTNLPINGRFLLTNQSNVNLTLTFADKTTAYAPAWQITPFVIPTTNPVVNWSQQTTLAGTTSPISQCTVTCFLPNEDFLGTYPVSIQHTAYVPNTVSASAVVNSLSNENGAINTEVIDVGTSNNNKLLDLFNDHFVWGVEQSLVRHQVLKGQASGNPLLIGQAGDITEVLGRLMVDQAVNLLAALTVAGNFLASNGLLGIASAGDLIDASGTQTILKGISNGDITFQSPSGTNLGNWDATNKALKIATVPQTINGTTNGTATIYQPFTGSFFKIVILEFNAYRNASLTEQTINLPEPFTFRASYQANNGKVVTPYSSGVPLANKVTVITGLAAGGGSTATQNTITSNGMGEVEAGFDALGLGTNQVSNATALYTFIGR